MRIRLPVPLGWITFDHDKWERLSDRWVPRRVDVDFPGDGREPSLSMVLEVRDGIPVCASVTITSRPGSREVRRQDLRAVPVEDWVESLFAVAAHQAETTEAGEVALGWDKDIRLAARKDVELARRGLRRKVTPAFLADVADTYREHVDDQPVQAVRARFGGAQRTAAGYIEQARKQGLLPPTTRGKAKA